MEKAAKLKRAIRGTKPTKPTTEKAAKPKGPSKVNREEDPLETPANPEEELSLLPSLLSGLDMHRHHGIFLARNRNDAVLLLTQTTTTEDDYGEKRLTTEFGGKSCVFRSWSPFRSKLAAGVMTGLRDLHLQQGSKVLYLGAGFGRTITHLSDIVGESGKVYAVEHGPWTDRELEAIAARRPNIHPVIENATLPYKYRNLVPASIDVICCDLPQADQVHSLKLNARHYLVPGGHFLTFMRTPIAEGAKTDIVALECGRLRQEHLEPQEQISLVPFMPGFTLVAGVYTRRNGVA